jgi:hypothetical protein
MEAQPTGYSTRGTPHDHNEAYERDENEETSGTHPRNYQPEEESNVMPKAKKTIKVRDQKPIKDPKGGMGHRHAINTSTGKNTNRHHLRFAPN